MTHLHNSLLITLLLFAFSYAQQAACPANSIRCTGTNTYQVCTAGVYGANQTCQAGLVCSPSGNTAYCVRPSEVTTGVRPSATTAAPARMTTGAACPENNARCTGTSTYQVCTGGSYGANQTCQAGLVCSTAGNNAFCVRPSEATTGVTTPSTTGAAPRVTTGSAPAMMTTGISCPENNARCTGTSTYQVCTGGSYGANQTCQAGLVCSTAGNNAFCVRPSEVTTGASSAAGSTTMARMTTGAVASSTTGNNNNNVTGTPCSPNGSQRCISSNTYATCTNGFYSQSQSCGALSCSPFGNNIYCIRRVTPGQSCPTNGYQSCVTSETYSTCTNNFGSNPQSCSTGTTCRASGNNIICS